MQMNRRSLPRYLGVLTVVIALAVSSFGCGANIERGKVLFGTDKPTRDSKCTAHAAVTSVSVTTSVYATYVFKAKPADEVISLEVTKDGQSFLRSIAVPTSETKGRDCFGDIADLSKVRNWAAGTFHFKLTSPTDTVAEGDLTVK
ncbi:MAG TPA: hypothetical protein VF375_10960 [Candidatus Limnocylindrales bacterium]